MGHPVVNESDVFEFIGTVMDITDLKRAEQMRAAMARERELFAQQRAAELAKANEALRGCLDALASVPELDDFLGQVMAAITRPDRRRSSGCPKSVAEGKSSKEIRQILYISAEEELTAAEGLPWAAFGWPMTWPNLGCWKHAVRLTPLRMMYL